MWPSSERGSSSRQTVRPRGLPGRQWLLEALRRQAKRGLRRYERVFTAFPENEAQDTEAEAEADESRTSWARLLEDEELY